MCPPFPVSCPSRGDRSRAVPSPHRPERAQLTHSVPHARHPPAISGSNRCIASSADIQWRNKHVRRSTDATRNEPLFRDCPRAIVESQFDSFRARYSAQSSTSERIHPRIRARQYRGVAQFIEHSVCDVRCDAEQPGGLRRGEPQPRHFYELSANAQDERGHAFNGCGPATQRTLPKGLSQRGRLPHRTLCVHGGS